MDLVTNLTNLIATPTILAILFFLLPPLYLYKTFLSFFSSLFPENMANKVVLITGASSGLGEQMAYQYAKKGANLVLVARRENSLKEVAENAMALGAPDVLPIPADVAQPDDCRRFVEATVSRFGRLDHLVTNAGIVNLCVFEEVTEITKFNQIMDINFWGSVYASHFAIPHLKRTRGRIIVNASAAGWSYPPRMSFYNASKAAMISFYETLRAEFGPEVKVTIATPGGWVETEMVKGKHLSKEGVMHVDADIRDAQLGPFPVWHGENCAKAIVDAACRGNRVMTDPTWFRVLFMWKLLAPEVMEWFMRMLFVPGPGKSHEETWNKYMLDITGAKSVAHPPAVRSGEVKQD